MPLMQEPVIGGGLRREKLAQRNPRHRHLGRNARRFDPNPCTDDVAGNARHTPCQLLCALRILNLDCTEPESGLLLLLATRDKTQHAHGRQDQRQARWLWHLLKSQRRSGDLLQGIGIVARDTEIARGDFVETKRLRIQSGEGSKQGRRELLRQPGR